MENGPMTVRCERGATVGNAYGGDRARAHVSAYREIHVNVGKEPLDHEGRIVAGLAELRLPQRGERGGPEPRRSRLRTSTSARSAQVTVNT